MESIWIRGMMPYTYKITWLIGHNLNADVFQERTVNVAELILEAFTIRGDHHKINLHAVTEK